MLYIMLSYFYLPISRSFKFTIFRYARQEKTKLALKRWKIIYIEKRYPPHVKMKYPKEYLAAPVSEDNSGHYVHP